MQRNAEGGLYRELLYTDHWFLVLPEDHRLSRATEPIPLAELRAENWIAGETVTHFLSAQCKQTGFAPRIVHHSSEYRIMITLVSMGHGISCLPIIDRLAPLLPPVALKKLDVAEKTGTFC
ncbi:hypothetical protein GCM10022222_50850 [Amycolatopsis ultiminotia]|uniref:LysR substrate-binding domain-containing protein n=1 Tax=Amycolatopsis ultiminotia TaxID=543629 RepID=A0ABP6X4J8_9PSEU